MRIDESVRPVLSPPSRSAPPPTRAFSDLLDRAREAWVASERDHRQLEASSAPDRTGPLSPADLLRLQVTLYRYVERIELATHVADRCNGAIKTILQTQV